MLAHLLRWLRRDRQEHSIGDIPVADFADLSAIPALVQSGRSAEAETALRAVLARQPDNVDALHYLGLVCHQSGRHGEAVPLIAAAVARAPELAFLRANFAEALRAAGDLAAAEREARAALELEAGHGPAAFNLASVLSARGAHQEALEHALRLLGTQPDWFEALLLAANLYIALDERVRAQELLARARHLRPLDPAALALSLRNRAWLCDWAADGSGDSHGDCSALTGMLRRWAERPDDPSFRAINPFIAYEYPIDQALRDHVTQACAEHILRQFPPSAGPTHDEPGAETGVPAAATGAAAQRLRIGYVSADFHNHPTMHLMRSLFGRHDRARFEIFAYSLGADDGSHYRRDVVNEVDHFVDLRGVPEKSAAQRIRADGIHILVDLKGYTHEARPGIFSLRPAPLRVAWLGYPASTGQGLCDYLIADGVVAPAREQPHYGEQLVRMPHSYQVNDHAQPIASDTPSRASLGLPEQGFVFGCFNHVYKIEPRMFAVWMRILGRVPGSVLWLYVTSAAAMRNLQLSAGSAGIDPQRLVFAGTAPKPEHLARLRQADLVLDTLWINAHTGASDALWAGVPVLTCPQDTFASRVAASLVAAAELPQLACATLQDYEDMAVRLALQPQNLASLRSHLQRRHEALPLFNTARFARNLEKAFEEMWRRHAAGQPPQPFSVVET